MVHAGQRTQKKPEDMRGLIHIIYLAQNGQIKDERFLYHGVKIERPEQILSVTPDFITDEKNIFYNEWRELSTTCPAYEGLRKFTRSQVKVKRNEDISWKDIAKSRMEQKAKDNGNNRYKTSKKLIKNAYRVKDF